MSIEGLDKASLRALDYILNYQPGTRIKYVLDDDIVEELEEQELIDRIEKKDDYSNYYEVLEIRDEHIGDIRDEIEEYFEDIYPGFSEDRIQEIFQENVGEMFALFDKARSTEDNYVRESYQIPVSLFDELSDAGFGFRRRYLTTSDNINDQLVFRIYPEDGKEAFLEFANSVIRSHLEGLDQIDKWAIYVKSAVGSSYIESNPAEFSPERLKGLKDSPEVSEAGNEDLEFIQEDIKDFLRAKIYNLLEKDSFYFSVLEFLKIRSDQNGKIDIGFLDEIGYDKKGPVEQSLIQLTRDGILLKRGDDEYVLSEQVKELLDVIEKRTVVVSYPIQTRQEAQEILFEILDDAEDDIKIIDGYFDDDSLKLLNSVVPKKEELTVHILTAVGNERREDLLEEYNGIINPDRFEIKAIESKDNAPHDRFIIVDGEKIWQVGHSLNRIGHDFSTIFLHSEEESHHYRELFDTLWAESEPIR